MSKLYLVQTFTHLKDMPHAAQALENLQRIASLVKPIMKKHNWILPALVEFYPDNRSLQGLNLNGGEKIFLRLRNPADESRFLDIEQVVLVMLHELTHNVHGDHDQQFYKFLNQLVEEWNDLRRSGYSGEGFHSTGTRLGMGVSHDVPKHQARIKAIEAAEKRQRQQLLSGTSRALGGRKEEKSPRELAAAAAERRALDEKRCGSGPEALLEAQKATKEGVVHTAGEESGSMIVDPDMEVNSSDPTSPFPSRLLDNFDLLPSQPRNFTGTSAILASTSTSTNNPTKRGESTFPGSDGAPTPTRSEYVKSSRVLAEPQAPESNLSMKQRSQLNGWTCSQCTLRNTAHAMTCTACELSRSSSSAVAPPPLSPTISRETDGVTAEGVSKNIVLPAGQWACPSCTLINQPTILQCLACATIKPFDGDSNSTQKRQFR